MQSQTHFGHSECAQLPEYWPD